MTKFVISKTYKIQEFMMSIMGYWHKENPTIIYKCRGVVTMSIFLTSYVTMILQFAHDINDFQKLCEILYMLTSYTSYFCKLMGYLYARSTFLDMLHHLTNPIFLNYPEDLDYHLSKILNMSIAITKLYRGSCAMVVILFSVYPLIDNKLLPTPIPFELGKYTFIMYIVQSLALLIAAWNNFCLDTLCICLMGLAAGQFDIIKQKILRYKDVNEIPKRKDLKFNIFEPECQIKAEKFIEKALKNCIMHHNAVIKFVEQIEGVFSFGLLTQLLGSIVVICNTGFFLLLVSPVSFQFGMLFSYFITMMAQLSLYCWYGNEIILKSVEISEACYFCEWYTCNLSIRKSLFVIMERSKRPLTITALKFSNLSLAAFSSIIQSSYSYFAFCNDWRRISNLHQQIK